jgi:hypothetical protein
MERRCAVGLEEALDLMEVHKERGPEGATDEKGVPRAWMMAFFGKEDATRLAGILTKGEISDAGTPPFSSNHRLPRLVAGTRNHQATNLAPCRKNGTGETKKP